MADTFLRGRGTCLEAVTQADLKALMGDRLARRTASTASYHKVPIPMGSTRSRARNEV